jgi:gluconolactonase
MFKRIAMAAAATLVFGAAAQAQDTPAKGGVLAKDARWERVSNAGKGTGEGVVAAPDGSIYLVDLAAPGTLYRYEPKSGKTTEVMKPTNMTNGLYFDRHGDLLLAQSAPGLAQLAKRNMKTGDITRLADSYNGKPLIAPNDITMDGKGRIYFTDGRFNQTAEPQLPNSIYRLDPDGKLTLLTTDVYRPNGIEVSPDGKRLYVADTIADRLKPNPLNPGGDKFGITKGGVIAFDIKRDGTLAKGRVFWKTDAALADGTAMDTSGNLYVASNDRANKASLIVVISPAGKVIQELPLPPEGVTVQLGFGRGEDAKTLYVSTAEPWGLWKIRTKRKGFYRH